MFLSVKLMTCYLASIHDLMWPLNICCYRGFQCLLIVTSVAHQTSDHCWWFRVDSRLVIYIWYVDSRLVLYLVCGRASLILYSVHTNPPPPPPPPPLPPDTHTLPSIASLHPCSWPSLKNTPFSSKRDFCIRCIRLSTFFVKAIINVSNWRHFAGKGSLICKIKKNGPFFRHKCTKC